MVVGSDRSGRKKTIKNQSLCQDLTEGVRRVKVRGPADRWDDAIPITKGSTLTKYNRDAEWIRKLAAGSAVEWVRVADADTDADSDAVSAVNRAAEQDADSMTGPAVNSATVPAMAGVVGLPVRAVLTPPGTTRPPVLSNPAQAAVRGLVRTAARDEVPETGLSGCGLPGVEENADPCMHYNLTLSIFPSFKRIGTG